MDNGPSIIEMPPRGHYLAHEVGSLAGVSGALIGQWARYGYIRASQGKWSGRLVYSFQDVGEAIVVHELLDHNFSRREIRSALTSLREVFGLNWPLSNAPGLGVIPEGSTDKARGKLALAENGEAFDLGAQSWQTIVNPENLERIATYLARGGWAAKSMPDLTHIEVDPDRLSGEPVIRGTRISAAHIGELAAQVGEAEVRKDYDISIEEIRDARRWWNEINTYSQAA